MLMLIQKKNNNNNNNSTKVTSFELTALPKKWMECESGESETKSAIIYVI